ncbi:hypothetical protein Tco_0917108 [Tanacetum coccineum]
MHWLKDTVTKRLIEELEKLMNEMVNMDNNIPDEGKVNFISTHLYDIALKWHKQFLATIHREVDWVLYKEALLLRFGNIKNKQFLSDNVKDSSCGLHVIGNVSDFSVNDSHYDVNLEKNEGAHKMFDEMSSKGKGFEVYDAYVKESIEVGNRIVENVVVETAQRWKMRFVTDKNISKIRPHNNNGSLVRRIKGFHLLGMYVDKGYVEGWEDEDKDLNVFDYDCEVYDLSTKALLGEKEFFVNKKQEEDLDKIKRVIKQESVKELVDGDNGLVDDKLMASNCDPQGFSKGGKRVCDLGGSRGRNVSGKKDIETNCKLQILVVVASYVWVEKSLFGSKECEFGGVGEQVPADISKQGMGGNELVSNDIIVGITDKLTDKWFKISTFMETQVGYLSIRLWCFIEDIDSIGGRIGSQVIMKCDVVTILAGEMNPRDMTSVANIFEVTKFGMTKRSVS